LINLDNVLVIIPARKGSKGIPGKNKKLLNGKPLIQYTIDIALSVIPKKNIYVSTDDEDILEIAKNNGLSCENLRPISISGDNSSAREVMLYEASRCENIIDQIIYLQPTSPLRKKKHLIEALNLFEVGKTDMVVSVSRTKSNPYFNLYEENTDGYLKISKNSTFKTRQSVPEVFEINGAIYIIDIRKLREKEINEFKMVKKYIMPKENSIDIDDDIDWILAEHLINIKEN
jgi:CMP-N,N'-diacetyllegionaminic acid synthase